MDTLKSTNFTMEVYILFHILLLVGYVYGAGPVYDVDRAPGLYSRYIQEYNKTYTDLQDLLIHYESFKKQLIKINTYNSVTSSSADINEYADYTADEKAKLFSENQVSTYLNNYVHF